MRTTPRTKAQRLAELLLELKRRNISAAVETPDGTRFDTNSETSATAIPYCPHTPTVKQAALHALDHTLEVFFGGAARGGKTDGALQAALRYVHVPDFAALVVRRNYKQLLLPDGVLSRANEWLLGKPGVRWVEKEHSFVFDCPGGGHSRITFGHIEHENDKYQYQGARFQLVVPEEVTHFSASQYRYLFSRLSRPSSGPLAEVPLRMRPTGNPGGVGHFWVYNRFINPETRDPDAVFLPSFLQDNPHEDAAAYTASLDRLDPVERKQLLEGVWDAVQKGDIFVTDRILLLDAVPPGLVQLVRFWDCAATEEPTPTGEKNLDPDFTASCLMGIATDQSVCILDVTEDRWDVGELPMRMVLQADADGRGTSVRIEEEGGSSGKLATRVYETALGGYDVGGIRSTGAKTVRARPLSAAVFNRKVSVVRGPRTKRLLELLHSFPYVSHDDVIDACTGAYNFLAEQQTGETKVHNVPIPSRTGGLRDLVLPDVRGLMRGR